MNQNILTFHFTPISNRKNMKFYFFIFFVLFSSIAVAQVSTKNYKIYDSRLKKLCSLEDMVGELSKSDVVFFGEEHNDPTGHQLESEILKMLHQKNQNRQVLSMEMFEADVQQVLNEYLQSLIGEKNFIKEGRAWKNYTDYKPLIEYAAKENLRVIAANTPNRYVNRVSRKGLRSLDSLSRNSKKWLPPLPIDTVTGTYYENFLKSMGGHQIPGMSIYQAQNLWDTGMAYSMYKHLRSNRKDKIFHLQGRFHSDEKLGSMARLKQYWPGLNLTNISCFSDKTFNDPDWNQYIQFGDYIIITNPDLKRTY